MSINIGVKKLGLYLDTLIIEYKYKFCSILYELILPKKFQNFMSNNVFWTKKIKTQQELNHKILCLSRESNRGPLALQSDALPLDHRDN